MLKVYVKLMKTVYNLDEYNISNFCVNTLKAFNKHNNKFLLFKELLHTFHDNEEIYEHSFESYASFISYSVIKDSLTRDKNILTYEQYVFNVLSGFYQSKNNKRIDTKILAKVWNNIVFIFNKILEISSDSKYKQIHNFIPLHVTFKHINSKTYNNTYKYIVPLLFEKEDSFDILIIVPRIKDNSYNIALTFLLNHFKNKVGKIYIVDFSLTSIDYSFNTLFVNNILLNQYRSLFDSLYIDFNKVSFQSCGVCPLSCNKNELFKTRYEPMPYDPNKKIIKVNNI